MSKIKWKALEFSDVLGLPQKEIYTCTKMDGKYEERQAQTHRQISGHVSLVCLSMCPPSADVLMWNLIFCFGVFF